MQGHHLSIHVPCHPVWPEPVACSQVRRSRWRADLKRLGFGRAVTCAWAVGLQPLRELALRLNTEVLQWLKPPIMTAAYGTAGSRAPSKRKTANCWRRFAGRRRNRWPSLPNAPVARSPTCRDLEDHGAVRPGAAQPPQEEAGSPSALSAGRRSHGAERLSGRGFVSHRVKIVPTLRLRSRQATRRRRSQSRVNTE